MTSSTPLTPTFFGHIASTQDALMLFEACLGGAIGHVPRRPHDRERVNLIKSGNVFIYEEHSSGIKRWTDGVPWSPSRILGNFLVYRELERPFPPGEKKRAMKRNKRSPGINKPESYSNTSSMASSGYMPTLAVAQSNYESQSNHSLSKQTERSLIGSLVDSYGFKEDGLVKKTVSVTVGAISHHLVSYYTVADVLSNKFLTPSKDPRFQHISPRQELISKQNFRTPIDEIDPMDRIVERSVLNFPYSTRNCYDMTNQNMSQQRSLSLPTPPLTYSSNNNGVFGNYTVNDQSGTYEGMSSSHLAHNFTNHISPASSLYSAPIKNENYDLAGYRQQRYSSMSGVPSDTNRSHMPSVISNFARRPSNYEQSSSIDSGLSSSSSSDSNLTNESGYSSQALYNSMSESSHNYTPQRSLPTPNLPNYERNQTQVFHPIDNLVMKDSIWHMGDVNASHRPYINTPPQWASAGSS